MKNSTEIKSTGKWRALSAVIENLTPLGSSRVGWYSGFQAARLKRGAVLPAHVTQAGSCGALLEMIPVGTGQTGSWHPARRPRAKFHDRGFGQALQPVRVGFMRLFEAVSAVPRWRRRIERAKASNNAFKRSRATPRHGYTGARRAAYRERSAARR